VSVSHNGKVYERDLGPGAAKLVTGIKAYDPGKGRNAVKSE
jgi:hypothetical protein